MNKKVKNSAIRDKNGINKFIDIKDECMNEIELTTLEDPREPIMFINDQTLAIKSGIDNYRSHYVLPMVIGSWLFFCYLFFSLGPNAGEIYAARDALEHRSSLNQEDVKYFQALLGDDGRATTLDYIYAVQNYSIESHKNTLKQKLVINFVMFLISLALTYWYIRFRIMAYIFFDRKRQIVYTWRKGRVAACRFENIGFREETLGLRLFLYGEKKKTENGYTYKEMEFLIQPSEAMYFNQKRDNTLLLAQLFSFMDQGKQAVIKGASFERKLPKTWQTKDKQPENFDARLDEILKREHELPDLYLKRFI